MTLFSNPLVLDLLAKYKPIAAMTHTSALLGWDLEINMPEAGAAARGQAQAEIELLRQKMTLDLAGLIEKVEKQKTLNDAEKGVIRVIKRELDFYQKIPAEGYHAAFLDKNCWRRCNEHYEVPASELQGLNVRPNPRMRPRALRTPSRPRTRLHTHGDRCFLGST